MSMRLASCLAAVAAAAVLAACAPVPGPAAYAPAPPRRLQRRRFRLVGPHRARRPSTAASPIGRDGQSFACTGSVALTPDTPYTRARFQTLYGSTDQAAIPEAVVRARTVAGSERRLPLLRPLGDLRRTAVSTSTACRTAAGS